ncbi:MAG: site-specific integrase [Thermoplasmata archaeon]
MPFAEELEGRLWRSGHTPLTTANVLRQFSDLSRWLDANGLGVGHLSSEALEHYLTARRVAGHNFALTPASFSPVLAMLAEKGLLPPAEPSAPPSPDEQLLSCFERYLREERALAPSTTGAYVLRARRFLADCGGQSALPEIGATQITAAVLRWADVSVGSGQHFVAALRAFLRYLFLEGVLDRDLSTSALAVTGRRRSSLPSGIARADAQRLLDSCDRRQNRGRRDFAVLMVLLRLGLRASEVAGLTLDDVDWRAGEITVSGKGARIDRLPLPAEVGEAIAAYIRRGRPHTECREIFLRAIAPTAPLGRGGISTVVRRACRKVGLPEVGAHRLRHTAASEMLAAGAPLEEIGQLLRHRNAMSTANYARVDLATLRTVAQPWPGSVGR